MAKYITRYGVTRMLAIWSPRGGDQIRRGDRVIVRTERGQEVGEFYSNNAGKKGTASGRFREKFEVKQ